MNGNSDKRMSLSDAVAQFVPDGAHISIGRIHHQPQSHGGGL